MAFFSTGPKIRLSVMTLSSSSRGFVVLRGYTLFSVTGNPERLERAKRFVINQQVGKIVVTI